MGNRKGLRLSKTNKRLRRRLISNRPLIIAYMFILLGSVMIAFAALSSLSLRKSGYLNPLASFILQRKASEVQAILDKEKIQYSKIEYFEGYAVVTIKDNGKVYLSTKKELLQQISSLQLVLSKLTIEGKRFKNLDFRFDKPVINF